MFRITLKLLILCSPCSSLRTAPGNYNDLTNVEFNVPLHFIKSSNKITTRKSGNLFKKLSLTFRPYERKHQPIQYDIVDAVSEDEDKSSSAYSKSKLDIPNTAKESLNEDSNAENCTVIIYNRYKESISKY